MVNNKKIKYISPLLTVISVDREITLVMISDPPIDPPGAPPSPKSSPNKDQPNPFGGSKPDYSKM